MIYHNCAPTSILPLTTTTPRQPEQQQRKRGAPQHQEKKTAQEAHRQGPIETEVPKVSKRYTAERKWPKHTTLQYKSAKVFRGYEHTCLRCRQTHIRSMPIWKLRLWQCEELWCACLPASRHTVKHVRALQIKTLVWQVETNTGGRKGVHLSSLQTDTPRSLKTL